jgi:Leucine-rich repeat (LRR) protein
LDIKGISDLRLITKLNVRNNQLKELPDELCYLDHLEGLNIRYNQITAFPANFGNLKLLQKL